MKPRWVGRVLFSGLLACAVPQGAQCAAAVEKTLDLDLAPLIDAAALRPERFAVNVPHAVAITGADSWTSAAGISTWRYSVRIPTAVSLSFHADRFKVPRGAACS